MTSTSPDSDYVLGTGRDELERLCLQNRLWADAAHAAWKRAGLCPGHRVLDVGAGPGFASFDLAELVMSHGRVVAVDESSGFIDHLARQAKARGITQLTGHVGDVQSLDTAEFVPKSGFDLAYARWVLCFVADPQAVVRGVAAALRPGGRVVVHDYFNYATMTAAPRRRAITRAVEATEASWRDRGGDPDVAGRLPEILTTCGLHVVGVDVHQRVARSHEAMFRWPDLWWRTYTPKLVAMGYLTPAEGEEVIADLDAMTRSATDVWVCPPMFEIVAERPR